MSARKTEAEEVDLVMLGSGYGSKFLAWTFAEQGQRVATIERKYLGGSCPNIACLPSKNIIHSAKVASYFSRGKEFGKNVVISTDTRARLDPIPGLAEAQPLTHITNQQIAVTTNGQ
jgi:pyruvate/2-oxoglutarate dehydrogenase complex dihydrolipoamide dehydrogenase (E3) component